MPIHWSFRKILKNFRKLYGYDKGLSFFYAWCKEHNLNYTKPFPHGVKLSVGEVTSDSITEVLVLEGGSQVVFNVSQLAVTEPSAVRPLLYLVEPHARAIWEGKKSLIVKTKRYKKYVGQQVFWANKHNVYGILALNEPIEGRPEHVRTTLRAKHLITDEEWFKWWPEPLEHVYVYSFQIVKKFDPPVEWEAPPGLQVWLDTVELPTVKEGGPTVAEVKPKLTIEDPLYKFMHPEQLDKKELADKHAIVHAWWELVKAKQSFKYTKEQVIEAHRSIVKEMLKRGFAHHIRSELDEVKLERQPFLEVRPSGGKLGKKIVLNQVLEHLRGRQALLKKPLVYLVGGLVIHGETMDDIDILIRYPKRIPDRDIPLEFRILRALPEELWSRVTFHYDQYYGPFTANIPLFDEGLIPPGTYDVVKMALVKEPRRLREAEKSADDDKIVIGRFFFPLKGVKGYRAGETYTPEGTVESFDVKDYPVAAQKKYDGGRKIVIKDKDKAFVITEAGFDVTHRYPNLKAALLKWPLEQVALDTETERWENGKHFGREDAAAYERRQDKPDDTGTVVNVFDVLYFNEPGLKKHDINCQAGDLHNEPYSVRLKYLDLLPIEQSTTGIPDLKKGFFNKTPTIVAENAASLLKAIKETAKTPFTEGAMCKSLSSTYPLTGMTRKWVKYKIMADLHVVIIERVETKTKGVYVYEIGLGVSAGWNVPVHKRIDVKGKTIHWVGRTTSTKEKCEPGDIITVTFHTLFVHEKDDMKWIGVYEPHFYETRPDQTTPDSIEDAVEIARDAKLLSVKKHAAAIVTLTTLKMDNDSHKFTLQLHGVGIGFHGDQRIRMNNYLDGQTIALMVKGSVKEDITTVDQLRKIAADPKYFKLTNEPGMKGILLYTELKAPEPVEWLQVEGVVKPGEVGARIHEAGVFYIYERGVCYLGTQKTYLREYFMYGEKGRLTGRWVTRKLPNVWAEKRVLPGYNLSELTRSNLEEMTIPELKKLRRALLHRLTAKPKEVEK